jgi:ssDNA thymidine ADP-ribosyltransferase, DarT
VDRLASIIADHGLLCDAEMMKRKSASGTTIGMARIKERRLKLEIDGRPGLHVGDCVPFYFCPRSVMLYLLHMGNHENLDYRDGQGPIVHLESDLHSAVDCAEQKGVRWAFTLSNAGAFYFESRCSLDQLGEINWEAVQAKRWSGAGISSAVKDCKQAEFLVERSFPWRLMERIGVCTPATARQVANLIREAKHRPAVEIKKDWYYL